MKKSLIALAAMTAVAGAAQAQSSVTIYGLIDSGYLSTESDGVRVSSNAQVVNNTESKGITSSASSSSRLGFRGTEDLGGGLRAEFVVETGLNATNSTVSTFNNRQSFIGLSSAKAGTFRIGTQYTAHHNLAAALSPTTGVNMAGDLNYTTGPTTSGAISNLGVVTTHAALPTISTTAGVAQNAAAGTDAIILAANNALIAAGLSSNSVLATGAAGAANAAPTSGVLVAAYTNTGGGSPAVTDAGDIVAINNAVNQAQRLLNADATAKLNARLALADMNGYTVRRNNTISYATPVINGFQLGLGYNAPQTSKVEGSSDVKASSQSISLSYNAGKLAAGVAYSSGKSQSVTNTAAVTASTASSSLLSLTTLTPTDNAEVASSTSQVNAVRAASAARTTTIEVKGQELMAGASYDLGVAKLGYIYSTKKAKDLTSDLIDRKSHSINATVPLGKVTAWANYGIGDQKIAVVNDYDLKAMQLGARYNFSKRTDVYAIYGQSKIDNKAASAIDVKDTQYAVGVRHQF